jgi:hypothetical protein
VLLTRSLITAAEKLSTKMKWHQLDHIQTVEKPHYAKRGKPQPDAIIPNSKVSGVGASKIAKM